MSLDKNTMKRLMLLIFYTIALLSLALKPERALSGLFWAFGLLAPFLCGAAIAFVLNVPMRFIERQLTGGKAAREGSFKRPVSLIITLALVFLVLGIVFFLLYPELADTFKSLGEMIPQFFMDLQALLEEKFAREPEVLEFISVLWEEINWKSMLEQIGGFVTTGAGSVLSSAFNAAASIASGLTAFGIAFIFAIYILLQKEKLARQFKKLFYAYFPERTVSEWLRIGRMAEQTFSKFLAGQCMEAVILGTMFFIALSLLKLPYALLIGVLIAFTALIPVFGAFIGCAVGTFLTLVVNPVQAVWFVIVFFVLQQIEGNLIYPHVVGNSVGLPSIWVLAAVSIGGSMLGVLGMLAFIPLGSVVYALVREDADRRLKKKAAKPVPRPGKGGCAEDEKKK